MPRGRKKKVETIENIDEKITTLNSEIDAMQKDIKEKKAELKKLIKSKAEQEKLIAEKNAAEEKEKMVNAIMSAVENGEKSFDDIIEFLNEKTDTLKPLTAKTEPSDK